MQLRGKSILITGGLGFIGSRLVRRLVGDNRLVVFDNGRRDALRVEGGFDHPNLTLIEGDVTDREALAAAFDSPQLVIHLAALAGVSSYSAEPVRTMEVTLLGTQHLLELAARRGVERLVHVSTSEVYGVEADGAREAGPSAVGPATALRWSYASAKLAAEHLCFAYHARHGLPVTSLRPFNVYGPGQLGESALRNFVVRALAGRPLQIHGDGAQVRAWCHVDDLLDGLLAAAVEPAAVGELFNLGNPAAAVTVRELALQVLEFAGSAAGLEQVAELDQPIRRRVPNIARARAVLGFEPRIGLESGLRQTIDWYRALRERGVTLQEDV